MNISKMTLVWKFITGGREGVLDYCVGQGNSFVDSLDSTKKDELKSSLDKATKILHTLDSLQWLCPTKWLFSYTVTVNAFREVVNALEDLNVTTDEVKRIAAAFKEAYCSWMAD